MSYDELISHLRECAKVDRSENTFSSAADAIEERQQTVCPHYKRNVHDRGNDSLCDKYRCEVKDLPRWISVKEQLPEEQKDVLVYLKRGGCAVDYFIPSRNDKWGYKDVTHWMPLPEPPDVREVRQGKWASSTIAFTDEDGVSRRGMNGFRCSECGGFCIGESHYCPNCGAKMDKEESHA